MGWRTKAFFRGVLIIIPVTAALFVFGVGKADFWGSVGVLLPIVLVTLLLLSIWFGFANLISAGAERRNNELNDEDVDK